MLQASVIVSTYNRLDALKLVLEGFKRQTAENFEVIVADDGSTDETRDYISGIKETYPHTIKHVWQEDVGFRKARILNEAIANSESKHVIFNDGDCIPHKEFVKAHVSLSEKGRILIGRSVLLSKKFSRRVDMDYVSGGGLSGFNAPLFFDYVFGDTKYWEYSLYVKSDMLWSVILRFKKSKTMFGGNFSVSKDDLIKVNGFNEDFTEWGNEDGEIGFRLMNSGLAPKLVLLRAINFHYYHKRGHVKRSAENVDRATHARESGVVRCEKGLARHLLHKDI